jgi:hypothetical protein
VRKKQRERGDDPRAHEGQRNGLEQERIHGRTIEGSCHLRASHPDHARKHRIERAGHHRQVDGQGQHKTQIFAEEQLIALDRLREQAVHAALLHLLGHQTDADEYGNEETKDGGRGQPQVPMILTSDRRSG